MTWEFKWVTYPRAKRDYKCDACECLANMPISDSELSDDEKASIAAAKSDGFKIIRGQEHLRIHGIFNGEWATFRARIDMHEICKKHGIYAD